jgi:hypothetical protein
VTFLAASGDSGAGTIWPAVSPNVVSVGGTTLKLTSSNTIYSETGWGYGSWSFYFGGSGGGFSQYESLPSYQQNAGISTTYTQFGVRLNPDVAYDANPSTGFSVIDAGRLYTVGGTSAGAPQWAGLVAIANQARASVQQPPLNSSNPQETLSTLYSNPSSFHDITSGSTGAYSVVDSSGAVVGRINVTAAKGYDLVTGLGSPAAGSVVAALAPGSTAAASHPASTTSSTTSTSGSGSTGTKHLDVTASSTTPSVVRAVLAAPVAVNFTLPQVSLPTAAPAVGTPASLIPPAPSLLAFPLPPVYAGGPDPAAAEADATPNDAAPEGGAAAPRVSPAAPLPQGEGPGPGQANPPGAAPLPSESLPGSGEVVLPDGADGVELRPGSSAAALGLAVALAFCWEGDLGQSRLRKHWRLRDEENN